MLFIFRIASAETIPPNNISPYNFSVTVLSIISLALSYLYPRFVSLPIEFKTGLTQKLKEYWLAVPDRERLPAIFLTTFLASSSLFLTTLLL